MNDSLRDALRLFDARFNEVGKPAIARDLFLKEDLPEIDADPEMLHRAFQNLVLNALDAMPTGGTLTLRTADRDDKVAHRDHGYRDGLSPAESARLFTPYFTTKPQGTGLGLAIVQSVISDHHGTIVITSEEGRGTAIRIELPQRQMDRGAFAQDDATAEKRTAKAGCGFGLKRNSGDRLPRKAHLLLVDDDPNTLASLSRAFRMAGHEVTVCDNASRAVELLRSEPFDLVFSDVVMPGKTGIDLLEELKSSGIKTPIMMISGQANIEMAVRATSLGALDFLEKPLSTDKLLLTIENALRLSRLENENRELRHRLGKHESCFGAAMKKLLAQIERVAASETRVCILGETGTGKELVARAIHEKCQRPRKCFCHSELRRGTRELIESELFGHEKGSFTGAAAKHLGKFEQADGGTLFLDEIGDMPVAMQAKLLRVLEEGEVERVGGDKPDP